jgi:alanyl-tRNA synthetase
MKSSEVRKAFLDFFRSKNHEIVASAPLVVKNDPTLMFTNAGMNQFKDLFLGNEAIKFNRISDTQKCLRVSGKHNDLEEVGHDTYHHTMFEMLGNWSFGNYFKKEAIEWAWELLTEVYKIEKDNLYVTVFKGDKTDGTDKDMESYNFWGKLVAEDRILFGSKKDNFWEMGDTGPCGPCSEIHIDIRNKEEKKKLKGRELVNKDHPLVIEIWNLVFIEFSRKTNGELVTLPAKHVDTGMGFERLCMVLQGVQSNYDTDIFQPLLQKIAQLVSNKYGENEKDDIAMRVIADHLRAVSFAIADGQLPSNTGAGYVIRRILRRAVRYGFTFLNFDKPFINKLVPILSDQMGNIFPELKQQKDFITKVILEEEQSFLRTLASGIKKFEHYQSTEKSKVIKGEFAFELFDTYGFPIDLTQLMAQEKNLTLDIKAFNAELEKQKNRSRNAAQKITGDWIVLNHIITQSEFIGYDNTETEVEIIKYREVKAKKSTYFEIVLDKTPFYAESGGQVGDIGYLMLDSSKIEIFNTKKDNKLIVHYSKEFINDLNNAKAKAFVNITNRNKIKANHSATHLLHAALREVLGTHVEQKGSLVQADKLRFDFSHFSKLSKEEIKQVEKIVNKKVRENIILVEYRNIPISKAEAMGAIALFGEKYGKEVRVIQFGKNYSTELCGGTHVSATGEIGLFKIVSEGAIASGVRRIEAITAEKAEIFYEEKLALLNQVSELLKNPVDLLKGLKTMIIQNDQMNKSLDIFKKEKIVSLKADLQKSIENINGINLIRTKLDLDMGAIKNLAFTLNKEVENMVLLVGSESNGKANLSLMIAESIVKTKNLNAGQIIREISKEIKGGGGGQPHFATAGGTNVQGIVASLKKIKDYL